MGVRRGGFSFQAHEFVTLGAWNTYPEHTPVMDEHMGDREKWGGLSLRRSPQSTKPGFYDPPLTYSSQMMALLAQGIQGPGPPSSLTALSAEPGMAGRGRRFRTGTTVHCRMKPGWCGDGRGGGLWGRAGGYGDTNWAENPC